MFSDATMKLIQNLTGYLNVLSSAGKLAQSDVTIITKAVKDIGSAAYADGKAQHPTEIENDDTKALDIEFYCTGRGADARGYYLTGNRFIVLEGSRVSHGMTESFLKGAGPLAVRLQLESDGTIVEGIFTRNYIFSSPSQAAGVIQGASSDGGAVWRDINKVPLKALK